MEELVKREILMGLEEDEIDLFELFRVLLRHWKLVLVFPVIVAIITTLYSMTLPDQFKSTGTIFVHGKSAGLSSALANFSGMINVGSLMSSGGSSAEYLPTLMKSRTMKNHIISQFGLATSPIIFGNTLPADLNPDKVMKRVDEITSVDRNKDGLISISAETVSASLSASIVKGFIDQLALMTKGPALEKRVFIEAQLKKVSAELEKAETDLKAFQDTNQLVSFNEQALAIVERLASLETKQIESDIALKMTQRLLKEIESNPGLVTSSEDESGKKNENNQGSLHLEGKKIAEQAKQEAISQAIAEAEGNLARLPELSLRYARLKRDLLVKEKVFSILTEQFEMAKITEAEEGSAFEIVDLPTPAFIKSKPRRSIMVILASLSAGVLAVFLAFLIEFVNKRQKAEAAQITQQP